MSDEPIREGLEGVVATATRLSHSDGEAGRLIIAGYEVQDVAPIAVFEELTYLLWYGRRPNSEELVDFTSDLASRRRLPEATVTLMRNVAAQSFPVMDALRMGVATLDINGRCATADDAARTLLAAFPALIGGYWRLCHNQEMLPPKDHLSHAEHYLHQIFGDEARPERSRALETYLNTVCDHGLNASTFTARVIVSTNSDLVSAITGAVGALKGSLHGGAPGPVLDMIVDIGSEDRAETVLGEKLAQGQRLMGFGHRVYRVRDPRADVLAQAADDFYADGEDQNFYTLARGIEATALRLLAKYRPERRLATNVEFYTALLLHGLGIPKELFTPTFAISRVAGWCAHCFEQLQYGRLIRPGSAYIGPRSMMFGQNARKSK